MKGFADELEALEDATQVIQGEIGGAKEPTTDLKGFVDVPVVMQRQVPQV